MSHLSLPLTDLYSPIRDDLAVVERIFDEEIASDFDFVNGFCDTVRSYRGKMLRPAMLLLAGKATGELSGAHRTLAAVVEMVHMATLVHDDVLDEADERRRQPTIASIAGNTTAVLLGDYLISHAFHLCSGLQSQYASRRIGATTNLVCEGELLQNHHRGDLDLTEETYLQIIRRKTGTLTAVSAELGAKFAGPAMPSSGRCMTTGCPRASPSRLWMTCWISSGIRVGSERRSGWTFRMGTSPFPLFIVLHMQTDRPWLPFAVCFAVRGRVGGGMSAICLKQLRVSPTPSTSPAGSCKTR